MNDALRARITGRAARWLELVKDYGHLDEEALDMLLVEIADDFGEPVEALVDLPVVRRIAAELLFDRSPEGEDGDDVVAEDWALLFY